MQKGKTANVGLVEPVWERQPGETQRAFAAFKVYRDTPTRDRSIRAACASYYPNLSGGPFTSKLRYWEKLSSQWSWVQRVEEFEAYVDQQGIQARIDEIKRMNERHVQIATGMISKAAQRLRDMEPAELTVTEMRLFFESAARLERLARGEAETRSEFVPDVTKLSDAELQAILASHRGSRA